MLIEFSVGNYRSFKEKVTFSMVAANLVSQDKNLDNNNIFAVDEGLSLVKSAAIYGANASGKSNLAKALQFMMWFMINSFKETQSTDEIWVEPYRLSTETEDRPSFFEIVFLLDGQQHRYGFTADRQRVISEWLYYIPKIRETKLFSREYNDFDIARIYKANGISERTRSNALFVSVSAQFNVEKSASILDWLMNQFILVSGLNDNQTTLKYIFNQEVSVEAMQLLNRLDLDIVGFRLQQFTGSFDEFIDEHQKKNGNVSEAEAAIMRDGYDFGLKHQNEHVTTNKIKTLHRKFNHKGEQVALESFSLLENESDGTQKLFMLASILLYAIKHGSVLVIDEFDARWHPLMSKAIVKLFNSNETNPKNAQLILMTHDTNLLSNKIFRRDQVWFTEKDRYGATALYSLAEYKVRNDASYGSDYIKGKYGAIPYIQGTESLIEVHG
jgi:uncharacterized protein